MQRAHGEQTFHLTKVQARVATEQRREQTAGGGGMVSSGKSGIAIDEVHFGD